MQLEGHPFKVQIIGTDNDVILETAEGYAGLGHGENYKIRIENPADVRIAVQIEMDGIKWDKRIVVEANSKVDLDTIPGTGKKLTCFATGTPESRQALIDGVKDEVLGVISATISREKPIEPFYTSGLVSKGGGSPYMFGGFGDQTRGLSAAGSGLSGHSKQQFKGTYFDQDYTIADVTITLRLAHDDSRKPSLDAHSIPGREKPSATPVPPPLLRKGNEGPEGLD